MFSFRKGQMLLTHLLICTTTEERMVLLGMLAQILSNPPCGRLIADNLRMALHETGSLQPFRLSQILTSPMVKEVQMC